MERLYRGLLLAFAALLAASCTRSAPADDSPPVAQKVRPSEATTGPAVAKVMMWEGKPSVLAGAGGWR